MPLKIEVRDKESQSILFSCSLEESEKAYAAAVEWEERGLAVEVIAPGVSSTLADSLGASTQEQERLDQEMTEEIESHGVDSCCVQQDPT